MITEGIIFVTFALKALNCSKRHSDFFKLFFRENDLAFHVNCLVNTHEMPSLIFSLKNLYKKKKKKKKKKMKKSSAADMIRALGVKCGY